MNTLGKVARCWAPSELPMIVSRLLLAAFLTILLTPSPAVSGEGGCGDGVLEVGEECDGGIGCSATCQCDVGFEPTNPPSLDCQPIMRVQVTKADSVLVDNDGDGVADPGDTILYTVVIKNGSGTELTNAMFNDTLDPSTTGNGMFHSTPIARNDSYNIFSNVLSVPASLGVLRNDDDPDGGAVSVTAFDTTSLNGATISMAPTGSFTYTSPANNSLALDTFSYTITDDEGQSDTATVAIVSKLASQSPVDRGPGRVIDPQRKGIPGGNSNVDRLGEVPPTDVTVDLGLLNPNQSVTITFSAIVDNAIDATMTSVCNQGVLTADGAIFVETDDPDTVAGGDPTCTAVPQVDLAITKTDSADPVSADSSFSYSIQVSNNGPSNAENVVVTDSLPAGVTFGSTLGCDNDPNGVPQCQLGTVRAGAAKTVTVNVTSPNVGGTITNNASVASTTSEIDSGNNSTTEDTTVNPPNDPPVAVCTSFTTRTDSNCCADVKVSDIDGGSFDPDGQADIVSLCITGANRSAGEEQCVLSVQICDDGTLAPHSATLTITDTFGESDSCDAVVTLLDGTPPSITCPADIRVQCLGLGSRIVTFPTPAAVDNCDSNPVVQCRPRSGSAFLDGTTTTVTCTATDAAQQGASCAFDVTVAASLQLRVVNHVLRLESSPASTGSLRSFDSPKHRSARTLQPKSASPPPLAENAMAGLTVGIYEAGLGSCAQRVCGDFTQRRYACVVRHCSALARGVVDRNGRIRFVLPDGDYLAIGGDGSDQRLGLPMRWRGICLITTQPERD